MALARSTVRGTRTLVWLLRVVATGAHVCPELERSAPRIWAITSAPLAFLRAREASTLRDESSRRDAFPLALYQEEGAAFPRRATAAGGVASFAACVVDLFAVAPWVEAFGRDLADRESPVYRNLTRYLPNGLSAASAAPYLARKVAAMGHAVDAAPDGDVVLWVDVDCVFVAPPDAAFLRFVTSVDVATIARLPVELKRPETGVVSFFAGEGARRLLSRARALYEWGMVDIAATCQDEDRRCRRHLGLNDVVVFKRLLVGDDARWRDGRLRVGWFAVGCANRSATEPWAAAALRYAEVGAHGTNFCPGDAADAPVSPFNLFRYVAHAKGRNGVMGGGESFRRAAPAPGKSGD